MSGMGMDFVQRRIPGAALPLAAPAAHYCLVELASPRADAGLRAALETVLEAALQDGTVEDAAIAESEAQRAALWKLREEHAEAQKREGASVKNDVSVPVSHVPELIRRASTSIWSSRSTGTPRSSSRRITQSWTRSTRWCATWGAVSRPSTAWDG
jgi:FAD/FMN-containing dehydrogenase